MYNRLHLYITPAMPPKRKAPLVPLEAKVEKKTKTEERTSRWWWITYFSEDQQEWERFRDLGVIVDEMTTHMVEYKGDRCTDDFKRWSTLCHISWQLELTTEGKTHGHVLMHFADPCRRRKAQRVLHPETKSHAVVPVNPNACMQYGTADIKEGKWKRAPDDHLGGSGPFFFGEKHVVTQGTRNDARNAIDAIKAGATMDIMFTHFTLATLRYGNMMNKAMIYYQKAPRRCPMVYWIYGPPRTGKNMACESAGDFYIKTSATGIYWEGYTGQKCVILDDVDKGWATIDQLMLWTDGQPQRVGNKGSSEVYRAEKVFITANAPFNEVEKLLQWKQDQARAFNARIRAFFIKPRPEDPLILVGENPKCHADAYHQDPMESYDFDAGESKQGGWGGPQAPREADDMLIWE